MLANVRRGDVLVSSSDESEIEHKFLDHEVPTTRLSQLVSELSESPPLNDFSRFFHLSSLVDRLVRRRLRTAWMTMRPDMIVQLRALFGFQLLTCVVGSNEKKFLAMSLMLMSRRRTSPGGSIKAS
jgi:hypothetical protein